MIIDISNTDGSFDIEVHSRCGVYDIKEGDLTRNVMNYCSIALKEAKNLNDEDIVWFVDMMYDKMVSEKDIVSNLKKAIENNEFVVYYQPKVNMNSNTLCGCEALVRWVKDGKIIPPDSFIPVLEKEGRVVWLDFYVFEQVCIDLRRWLDQGITPVRVSSNFSKLHLKNPNFAENILSVVKKYNIDPEYLEIELTESSCYEDFDALTNFIARMNKEHIFTSIDDFGTGYSSLSVLTDVNVDVIKLDKSFIDNISDEKGTHSKMIENIIHMIKDLNRNVICEGVETKKQVEFLKGIGCYIGQGYLYDMPLPHDSFENRLLNPLYSV